MTAYHGYACGCRECSPERYVDYLQVGERVVWTREEWERVAGPGAPPPFTFFRPIDWFAGHRWWEGEALEDEVSA